MKIALLGSAPSSVKLAPFKNAAYEKWIEGKVAAVTQAHAEIGGEFQIWGCSPGCWAVVPRATRWFELHRWEPGQAWFGPEYLQFLRDFKGIVYTGGTIPEIPGHVVYPIDTIEEKFASYNLTSSLALMAALAIHTIEQVRAARSHHKARDGHDVLPAGVDPAELDKPDSDDLIGMWGVDMAAGEEYAYQRPGCQNFILEAMRRFIKVYLPPESDLMRPMPVYGISEWDHSYIKLTSRAREINQRIANHEAERAHHDEQVKGLRGEVAALQGFVSTWTSPYGMKHGLILAQDPGTGLGSGITHLDTRPITRMTIEEKPRPVMDAMVETKEVQDLREAAALGRELTAILQPHAGERGSSEGAAECLRRILSERRSAYDAALQATQHRGNPRRPTHRRSNR